MGLWYDERHGLPRVLANVRGYGGGAIYVINSGITSQSRRPRYEDITAMDKLTGDALDAIAYANAPADSLPGACVRGTGIRNLST